MFDKHKGSKESAAPAAEPRPQQAPPAPTAGPAPTTGATAMIGKGISISGDVSADSNLRIEGVIEGRSIQSKHDVEIAESGRVSASISAKVVRVSGEVTGDISGSEKVMIAKTGRVQGNVVAPRVQLEDGALFRGSIDMNPAENAGARPASKPTPVEAGGKGAGSGPGSSTSGSSTSGSSQGAEAAAGGTRKEPGLTLKSG